MKASNLAAALEAIAERCDEIVAVAEDDKRKLSDLFSFKESNRSINLCLDLAAFLGRHTVVTRTVFNALTTVVHRQLMKSEKEKRKATDMAKANGKGPQTDYKRTQRNVFSKFLEHHQAGSVSIYTRARAIAGARRHRPDVPAITVVTTTSQAATNDGDDEGANTQTTSADVKPDVDASVVPK